MTKLDLREFLCRRHALPARTASAIVETILERIVDALQHGEVVSLHPVGTLTAYKRKARVGRHPRTGAEICIPPRMDVRFQASKKLWRKL